MAVHLPLGNEAVLEAQMLMLASHNILNPANGAPITVPSQDMVLGLYYITKLRKGTQGEGLTFYGPEEATIAYNEKKLDIHAPIHVHRSGNQGLWCGSYRSVLGRYQELGLLYGIQGWFVLQLSGRSDPA